MEEVTVLNRWNVLPEECKSLILSKLSNKEIARIARVSKEFLTAVTALRGSVHLLVLPPTLSVASLESMVAAYPNLTSLSFKRCGLKLKSFVSIIRAAAMGNSIKENINKLDSEALDKKKIRSLTYVDFKNCLHLLDTDVNLLCSLHTRLEEVDFTNCPCLSDTTLLTLSRYQHFEKAIDPLENFKCYPRFAANPVIKVLPEVTTSEEDVETEEMFLKNNDAAVYEEIQGLALNGTNHFRSWPRLGASSDKVRRESMKVKVDDEKLGNSPYSVRKNDSKILAKKSYPQSASETMLLKTTSANAISMDKERNSVSSLAPPQSVPAVTSTCGKEKHITPSIRSPRLVNLADQATQSTSSIQTTRPVNMDPNLTFIDWGDSTTRVSAQVPRTARCIEPPANTRDAYDLSRPGESLDAETKFAIKYHNMYQQYVHEAEGQSSMIMPALRDQMSLITAQLTSPSPVLTHEDEDGMRYTNIQTTLKDDRMTRTQTSLYYPRNSEQDSNSSSGTRNSSGLKSSLIAGATEIKDERLDLSKRANCSAEAFCRTENHVGIFTVSDPDARRKSGIPEIVTTTSEVQGSRGTESPSQLAICLPGSIVIGGKLRRQRHLSVVASESGRTCRHGSESMQDFERESMNEGSSETDAYQTKGSKALKAVYIGGCPEITDRGVQALLKGALRYSLSILDVSRCGGVTNAGLRIPARSALQQLVAVQMPSISRLVYQLPVQSQLHHLNLAGCYKLEELVIVAPSLKLLNLANCKKLTRLQLKCPSLTTLNLSLCDCLERFVSFQCGQLRSLNFYGCRMLLQSTVNTAIEIAASLEELRCGGCERIERLDLVQPTLLTLEVSGCQTLKRLFCQSRVLKVVDACGCKSLVEVYLYSPFLRRMLFSNCALLQILVIPLDAIKETMDISATQMSRDGSGTLPDALEISISGCNMPDTVKRNLGKLTKQWHSCFKSTPVM